MASQDLVKPRDGRTVTDQAYAHLRHQILICDLAPGAELREANLAESTGFGRTPIREALRRLVHDGLVEVRPRQGYRVAPITLDDVHHVFELRLILEPAAVELAIARASDEALQELHPLAHAARRPDDAATYEQYLLDHLGFHAAIAECSGNPRLARSVRDLLAQMQRLIFLSVSARDANSPPDEEHHDLFDAIVKRDSARAREIMIAQIEESRRRVADALVSRLMDPRHAALGSVNIAQPR
ncbi:GntR family transcriptional regulator [Actinopolymorpha sp. B17G11]|uniref:GntR family transcriptional regulator n=1 Tax=unclassified Actinopolymorpha TaxID=2627063 RepID=UPI0032D926AA